MTLLFFVAVLFCLYTYVGFPVWLYCRSVRLARHELSSLSDAPEERGNEMFSVSVSIVIAVHNEANNLRAKIASLDDLDYPADLLECIFVSDGSKDATLELLRAACETRERWHVFHYADAAGKPTALNLGVSKAKGEVIVFMDGRQTVSEGAVRALVRRLRDETIGVVSGELVLLDDMGEEANQVGLYWRYEKWIRDKESQLFSTTGATGALYAIRRSDYHALPVDALLDDFDTPIQLLKKGKRTVLESEAKIFDQAEGDSNNEFRRKARTLAGNFQSFSRHRWLFNPAKNPVWWQFLSHKVFRLLVPYALAWALVACVLGDTIFLRLMLLAQLCFYGVGFLGWLGWRNRVASVVKIFLQLNAAALVGAWRAVTGQGPVRWKSS